MRALRSLMRRDPFPRPTRMRRQSGPYAKRSCATDSAYGSAAFGQPTRFTAKPPTGLRKAEGCIAVEMECAALAACARFRGALFGQILFTADSLADPEAHDAREWGIASFGKALELAFDAAAAL